MRPRLISRGNSTGLSLSPCGPCFNEAPADQPGKCPRLFRMLVKPAGFNEAPADQPGKYESTSRCLRRSISFNEAPADQPGKSGPVSEP